MATGFLYDDRFLEHGKASLMLASVGLDGPSITQSIKQKLQDCKIQSEAV